MTDGTPQFWTDAQPWLDKPDVEKGTMMGFPCLRRNKKFFASVHRDGSAMIVKLSAAQVIQCVIDGDGEPFAPNGRVFKEWLALPVAQCSSWPDFLAAAYRFAEES